MTACPGMPQALRPRHASQTPVTKFSRTLSRSALVKKGLILGSLAWNYRNNNCRNSRVATLGSRL
eukprot:7427650-Pyramimonas_sp.AAC.1